MRITIEEEEWARLTEFDGKFQKALQELTETHATMLENNAEAIRRTEQILARLTSLEGEIGRINRKLYEYKQTFNALGVLINERTS